MKNEELEKIVDERIGKIRDLLVKKGAEYARGDRLSNFKKAGAGQGCTPERALIGMMDKHRVSIYDLVDDLEEGLIAPQGVWDEKIGDNIVYLFLLEALVRERRG
jgi:hypothetical protein